MPRGRKRMRAKKKENYECCSGGKSGKFVACGLALILLGLLINLGWSMADLLLLAGAVFIVKGLILSMMRK